MSDINLLCAWWQFAFGPPKEFWKPTELKLLAMEKPLQRHILSCGVNTIKIFFFKSKLHIRILGLIRQEKRPGNGDWVDSVFLGKLQKTDSLISFIRHI